MAISVQKVAYFYANVRGEPDEAFQLLDHFAHQGVNLLALHSMPIGPENTQLTLFPEDANRLQELAKSAHLALDGPHVAVLAQGDDHRGAVAELHRQLHQARVTVYASTAVTDGKGRFGYILYMRPEDAEKAVKLLRGVEASLR
jgi:hypothetical protein